MSNLFPYANIVTGLLVLVLGFGFHWIGQTISVVDWKLAVRLGLQEQGLRPEHKIYEHALAVADMSIGWIYGVAAVGLIISAEWGYALAWIPGTVLVYHAISFWFWEGNRRKAGDKLCSDALRIGWFSANVVTGVLTLLVAWAGAPA